MILLGKILRLHWLLFLLMVLIASCGVFFIESATFHSDNLELRGAASRQLTWLFIGLFLFFVTALVDYRLWTRIGLWLYLAGLATLGYVLAFGQEINNAKSWINLGGFSLQPSEMVKIAFITGLAWLILKLRANIRRFWPLILVFLLTVVPMALILKQPDLGSALVFGPIAFCMLLAGGARKRYLALPVLAVVAGIYSAYWVVHRAAWDGTREDLPRSVRQGILLSLHRDPGQADAPPRLPGSKPLLKPYQLNRIRTFFDPDLDPRGAGWAVRQSLIAVGSGGFKGKGYKQGDQNIYGFLPRNTSHNDYIFPVIAEEFGFMGAALVIAAQGLLLSCLLWIACSSRDLGGTLLTTGITALFFTHFFINTGMTIQVVPVTGIPLPLISYGGTFLVACMSALGIAQSIWIHRRSPQPRTP